MKKSAIFAIVIIVVLTIVAVANVYGPATSKQNLVDKRERISNAFTFKTDKDIKINDLCKNLWILAGNSYKNIVVTISYGKYWHSQKYVDTLVKALRDHQILVMVVRNQAKRDITLEYSIEKDVKQTPEESAPSGKTFLIIGIVAAAIMLCGTVAFIFGRKDGSAKIQVIPVEVKNVETTPIKMAENDVEKKAVLANGAWAIDTFTDKKSFEASLSLINDNLGQAIHSCPFCKTSVTGYNIRRHLKRCPSFSEKGKFGY